MLNEYSILNTVWFYTGHRLDKYTGAKRFKIQSIPDPVLSMQGPLSTINCRTFSSLVNSAVARATWAKYSSGYNAFCDFETFSGETYAWPLTPEVWRAFIVWCHYYKNLAANSIQTYLSALKFIHIIRGLPTSHLNEDKLSKLLLKGVEHTSTGFTKNPNIRRVMTFPLLMLLGQRIAATDWPSLDKQVVWAAALTSFFGTVRLGEILASEEASFSPASDLLWEDVRCTSPHSLLIHIKQPKSGIPGGEKVDLFEFSGYNCCPVRALKNLRKKQILHGNTDESLPVFRFSSGKNLTKAVLNRTLSALLSDIFVAGKDAISCHSFRAGIPSTLKMYPDLFTSDMVKGWGRWQSDCYQLYARLSLFEKGKIFEKISLALRSVASGKESNG
jgi:hypothetical protein